MSLTSPSAHRAHSISATVIHPPRSDGRATEDTWRPHRAPPHVRKRSQLRLHPGTGPWIDFPKGTDLLGRTPKLVARKIAGVDVPSDVEVVESVVHALDHLAYQAATKSPPDDRRDRGAAARIRRLLSNDAPAPRSQEMRRALKRCAAAPIEPTGPASCASDRSPSSMVPEMTSPCSRVAGSSGVNPT
jgi:hypothetical protein